MTPTIYQVAYVSGATRTMDEPTLKDILDVSQRNNAAEGLTGVLLYDDALFFQVIEGAPEAVKTALARIRADNRHGSLATIWEGTVPKRDFEAWEMGYAGPFEVSDLTDDALASLLDIQSGAAATAESNRVALILARAFLADATGRRHIADGQEPHPKPL